MALFSSGSRSNDSREDYSAVAGDEAKPLREQHEHHAGDEMSGIHPELYAMSRSLRRTNLFLKIIIGMLCVCLLAILSINVPDTMRRIVKSAKCDDEPLIKTPVPPLAKTKMTFEKHPIYGQRPNPVSDEAWNKLLPDGRGFVYIKDWEKYELPPGQNTSYGMIYSTAVFHQMHCLGQIRRFSYMFLDSIHKNDTVMQREIDRMFVKNDHAEHMLHCFDYLRQTIQCGGDMAMEWPRTEPNGQRFAVDGWGIPHECKDWDAIEKYMDKNHFDHSTVDEIAPLIGASG
ncbi:hypothetical protein BT63DRAFT_450376 [Microthyrium microscopicum]|uniref:Tat pathway signal sequence n=1 Tax=Microthyrium microscopicum TaxID=703497 RepID=A0A6A6UVC7_9PEZI|nr:hypothetical protein BT63DRAFT_450376 [Microthyrium microscopicum]